MEKEFKLIEKEINKGIELANQDQGKAIFGKAIDILIKNEQGE